MSTLSSLSFCFVLIAASNAQEPAPLLVNTLSGPVQGEAYNGLNRWRGIPYAKAPVNELRFAAPQPTETWTETFNAAPHFVPACPQICLWGEPPFCPVATSEDCLSLNVFAPTDAAFSQTSYTTMIWIHGGKFDESWATWFGFDPTNIMANIDDVIIVTINYRLGILGTLFDNQHGTGIDGNFGYLDQKMAIKWVYDNIEYFGGNPNNIVLFGESAGAQSIALHLLYNHDGYISSGIMQSPPFGVELRTPTSWYNVFDDFVNVVGCGDDLSDGDDLRDCLRDVPEATILAAQMNGLLDDVAWSNKYELWTPTVETELLANQPALEDWAQGQQETPPFIIGLNKDEHFLFINDYEKDSYSYGDLVYDLERYFGGKTDVVSDVLDYYGVTQTSTGSQPNYLYNEAGILNDIWYCAAKKILKETKTNYNIYFYSFDVVDVVQNSVFWGQAFPQCIERSCHATEIYYLWSPPLFQGLGYLFADTLSVGGQMQIFWTNYAKTLNPNDEGDDIWQMYSNQGANKNEYLSIQGPDQYVTEDFKPGKDDICLFWNNIGYAGDY